VVGVGGLVVSKQPRHTISLPVKVEARITVFSEPGVEPGVVPVVCQVW